MRKMKRAILLFFANIFSLINQILPKKNAILFFTNINDFNDNNRALFEYIISSKLNEKYKIYYSTPKINEFLVAKNVKYINIYKGLWVYLFSKYVFYDGGTTKIKPSKKQVVLSLWHGTPLKKIGRITEKSSKYDRFNDFTYVLTTSENCKKIFSDSFECSIDKVVVSGYPRNDYLFKPLNSIKNSKFDKKILWMPTFRYSIRNDENDIDESKLYEISIFKNLEELKILDLFLQEKNVLLVIKHHPLSIQNNVDFPDFQNIKIINNNTYRELNVQNYSFVGSFDCLLTDYSSVYFDFLLLNRPIGFVIDDIEKYKNTRGFTFENPLEMMPGKIIQDKEDFYNFIKLLHSKDEYEHKRNRIKSYIHTKIDDNTACKNILELINLY